MFILVLFKIKFLSKKAIKAIIKLVYILKNSNKKYKLIVTNKNKYFNYKLLKNKILAVLNKIAKIYLNLNIVIFSNKKNYNCKKQIL